MEAKTESEEMLVSLEGSRIIGRDILPGGQVSCLKQNLGTYQSPEHAEAMAHVFASPQLMLRWLMGDITATIINNVAAAIKTKKDLMNRLESILGLDVTNGVRGCRVTQITTGYRLDHWDDDTDHEPFFYTNQQTAVADIFRDMERFNQAPFEACTVAAKEHCEPDAPETRGS